jgi:hypothetical protein
MHLPQLRQPEAFMIAPFIAQLPIHNPIEQENMLYMDQESIGLSSEKTGSKSRVSETQPSETGRKSQHSHRSRHTHHSSRSSLASGLC